MFSGIYRGRRVLVTGHTGFKGSWLCEWLLDLGAQVSGYALAPETDPALFTLLGHHQRLHSSRIGDVRSASAVLAAVKEIRPEIIFHLAAQPLVRLSYREPAATWETNVQGTINVLEAARAVPGVTACVVVTSDKCYENREQVWGYRENDPMGGHDPYSSSKGAAELAVASWRRSFFQDPSSCRLASGRAGNVIGGGDWAAERLVVDCIKAIAAGRPLALRHPLATRPWQHVLEPLSGYLHLAAKLCAQGGERFAEGWNFGPADASVTTVEHLARRLIHAWGAGKLEASQGNHLHEAGLLKLDVSKARAQLAWHGIWDVDRTIDETVAWYRAHISGADVCTLTRKQIADYVTDARSAHLEWTHPA